MRTVLLAIIAVGAVCICAAGENLDVPLMVTEYAGLGRTNAPVCGGIPVEPLQVKDVGSLVVVDGAGKAVDAQLSPLVVLEDGTLSWVLADFLTELGPRETKRLTLKQGGGKPGRVRNPVTVEQNASSITLGNGVIKLVMSKTGFNLFESVTAGGKNLLAAQCPTALTLVRAKDKKAFSTRSGKVEGVFLEDSGPVRTTVRMEGTYGGAGDETWLKWTVRVTLWADNPNVRVLYAIRNVNPQVAEMAQIRQASLAIRLAQSAPAANYVVGAASPHMSRLSRSEQAVSKGSQWHQSVELAQVGPCEQVCSKSHRRFHHLVDYADAGYRVFQNQPGDRNPVVDVGFRCDGWINLDGDNGGCQLWLRHFTYDTPKKMTAAVDGTLALDLIPVYEGTAQPFYADGGYWLGDRSHRTYEANFYFHPEPVVTADDVKVWDRQFDNFTAISGGNVARLDANVRGVDHALQLVSTPEWYGRTGQMWGAVPSIEEENAAAKAMGRTKAASAPELDAGELLATEFIHYENFHYRSEWDGPGDALLEFLRTGEEHFYRRAHSYARNYRDLGVPRTDGLILGERTAGVSNKAGAVERWGKFCECHNYGAGLLDMWLVTGDRSYRDAGVEYGYVHSRAGNPYGGFGDRHWGRRMTSVLRTWQVTRDPDLRKWLVAYCRPVIPDEALRADGRALICGKHMASWMVGVCSHAIWHNWVLNQDQYEGVACDNYRDQLIGMARQVAKYWWFDHVKGGPYHFDFDLEGPGKVTTNGGGGPYTLSCVDMITRGYLLTGDPRLLAAARKFWDAYSGGDGTVQIARLQEVGGMGSGSFWARQLIDAVAHPRQDREPPSAVADLKAEARGGGKVRLTWTAPKDAASRIAAYQVKHAPCPMVEYEDYEYPRDHRQKWTWWAGYNVAGEPAPGQAGTTETMVVEAVPPGARHFALRSRDAAANESAMSNVAVVDTK